VTSSNRPTYCKAGADLITPCNADTCGDIDRAGWPSSNRETNMPKQQPTAGPDRTWREAVESFVGRQFVGPTPPGENSQRRR
jgi:hypothetical protein